MTLGKSLIGSPCHYRINTLNKSGIMTVSGLSVSLRLNCVCVLLSTCVCKVSVSFD
jgi:hypothetical protein